MTPQFRDMQHYMEDRSDQRRLKPDPETLQQTFCWLRASNAETQIRMLEKSHNHHSVVPGMVLNSFDQMLHEVLELLNDIMTLINDNTGDVEINPAEARKTGPEEE